MAKRPNIIPKAPLARILLNAGAKRVSQGALDAFADVLHVRTDEIATHSTRIAKHAGRKTVHEEDIKLAARQK
ncbi:MAG: histone [Candidatus Woesearchaeota archaeon]